MCLANGKTPSSAEGLVVPFGVATVHHTFFQKMEADDSNLSGSFFFSHGTLLCWVQLEWRFADSGVTQHQKTAEKNHPELTTTRKSKILFLEHHRNLHSQESFRPRRKDSVARRRPSNSAKYKHVDSVTREGHR